MCQRPEPRTIEPIERLRLLSARRGQDLLTVAVRPLCAVHSTAGAQRWR